MDLSTLGHLGSSFDQVQVLIRKVQLNVAPSASSKQ